MRLRVLWPGKTKSRELCLLQDLYLKKVRRLEPCELIETREARGLGEREAARIKEIEAQGLEKHLGNDYIICLFAEGQEMTSPELARFLNAAAQRSGRPIAFVVGGFLGLADRILELSQARLSLSRLTMPHELCRVVLLEQIYRSLTIIKGQRYAK